MFTFKKSLQTELNSIFVKGQSCTKSAFCQARKKIKISFFEDLFTKTVSSFYTYQKPTTFKKYRLWACDTTVQILPDNEQTRQIGIHKNQFKEVASVKISAYFDVFSKMISQAQLFDKRTADLLCCLQNQVKNIPKDVISIYDRGYGSQIVPFFHNLYESKYVIRLKTDFSKIVKAFIQSPDDDLIVTEPLSERTYKRLEYFGIRKSKMDKISYRLVKVILNTGEIEILMTNLDHTFSIHDLSELYRLRWSIETCFGGIKNHQMLGIFSGYSQTAVKQDLWCNLIFYNLHTISSIEAEIKVKAISQKRKMKPFKNKKKKNQGYQLNRNVGTNILRMYLPDLFQCHESQLDRLLIEMQMYYLISVEIVKESYKKRKRKMIRQNDRHHTEMNYKRGF